MTLALGVVHVRNARDASQLVVSQVGAARYVHACCCLQWSICCCCAKTQSVDPNVRAKPLFVTAHEYIDASLSQINSEIHIAKLVV